MTTNDHNTIGPRKQTAPDEACWDILAGQDVVGQIEAEYGDASGYAATRQSRYVVVGYKVWWYACDQEGFFAVSDHGTARKALAAAKAYAKATREGA